MSSTTQVAVAAALILYLIATYALAVWSSRKVESVEDFLVAGRRLPLSLAWATIMATWFGAATVMTASDEVRDEGLRAAALEPIGAGLCLVVAGIFFARKLWEMKVLTLGDVFRDLFGPRAEIASAVVMIPTYFGWIAVQFIALAGVIEVFFGLDMRIGIAVVAVVGTGYTFLGGMWAVTLTDAAQLVLLLIGLVVLAVSAIFHFATGPVELVQEMSAAAPAGYLDLIPTDKAKDLVAWTGVLFISMLGNIPGQDLTQRIFASKSSTVARRACLMAGVLYITFGAIPVFLGLISGTVGGISEGSVILTLASTMLSPVLAVIVVLAVTSAIISTIDSAILSPASVLAQNVLAHAMPHRDRLALNHAAVIAVASISLVVAYIGEDAYALLEAAYEIGLLGLFVPLALGLLRTPRREAPALATMGLGFSVWIVHLCLGWEHFIPPLTGDWEIPAAIPTVIVEIALYSWLDRDV